jgi:hypothetical protein
MFDKKLFLFGHGERLLFLSQALLWLHIILKKNEYGALIDKNGTKDLCNTMTNY